MTCTRYPLERRDAASIAVDRRVYPLELDASLRKARAVACALGADLAPRRGCGHELLPRRALASFQTRVLCRSRGLRSFRFRQTWRHEVRAFDASAPHHQLEATVPTLRTSMRALTERGAPQ